MMHFRVLKNFTNTLANSYILIYITNTFITLKITFICIKHLIFIYLHIFTSENSVLNFRTSNMINNLPILFYVSFKRIIIDRNQMKAGNLVLI